VNELTEIGSSVHEKSEDAGDRRWFNLGAIDLESRDTIFFIGSLRE
jgi:hypothetical protein